MQEDKSASRIRPGDKLKKFATTAREKFDHSPRWLWMKVKTPGFPQPIKIDGSPHFIEREIDEYLARCASPEKIAA